MTATNNETGEYATLSEQIQASPNADALTVPLRVRVTDGTETALDRAEAFFQGQGFKHVTRSYLVRVALQHLVEDLYAEHPEIDTPTTREMIT